MKINLSNVEKGPGVWIFNNSFLQDECYVSKIRKIFADEIGSEFYGICFLEYTMQYKFLFIHTSHSCLSFIRFNKDFTALSCTCFDFPDLSICDRVVLKSKITGKKLLF
jgi:hypothetical protein